MGPLTRPNTGAFARQIDIPLLRLPTVQPAVTTDDVVKGLQTYQTMRNALVDDPRKRQRQEELDKMRMQRTKTLFQPTLSAEVLAAQRKADEEAFLLGERGLSEDVWRSQQNDVLRKNDPEWQEYQQEMQNNARLRLEIARQAGRAAGKTSGGAYPSGLTGVYSTPIEGETLNANGQPEPELPAGGFQIGEGDHVEELFDPAAMSPSYVNPPL